MAEIACLGCGKRFFAEPGTGGAVPACPMCGRRSGPPRTTPTPGITIERGTEALGGHAGPPPLPPGRYRLAEARCRMWRKGGLMNQKGDHPVENLGIDGLTVHYGAGHRAGTIAGVPQKPPWDVGTLLDVAVDVGAYSTPLRFAVKLADIREGAGPGCIVELTVIEINDETRSRLQMLLSRDDMRSRRKTGMFGAAT